MLVEGGLVFVSWTWRLQVTYALAAAFQEYGRKVKEEQSAETVRKKFAIDLRSPEELEQAMEEETEA